MPKVYLMKGLPGSGKSTRAKQIFEEDGNCIRVNRDLLRTMLHFDVFSSKKEHLTKDAEEALIENFLSLGKNVIIDDTNLNPKIENYWKSLCVDTNTECKVIDLTNIPIETCILNDAKRTGIARVGPHVIKKMALQYLSYLKDEKVIICDIDGTVSDPTHRRHFARGPEKDWNQFFDGVYKDPPRKDVIQQLLQLKKENNAVIIFVSARPERVRDKTEKWLLQHTGDPNYVTYSGNYEIPNHTLLILREDWDKRPDTETKSEMFDRYLKHLNIISVFDDRPSVIRMWKSKGLNVIDVGDGEEF